MKIIKKQISNEKQLFINTIASLVVFAANIIISFFVTPYITESVGAEAYGFVGLANNFVNYATIVTIALNAVAGRFISVEYYKGNKDKASKYLSSVFFSNVFLAAVLTVVSTFIIINLEKLINISPELVVSVKLLFVFIVLNFLVSIISTVFSVATFITNKLYLSNTANMIGIIVRVVTLLLLFAKVSTSIYFIGITSLLASVIIFLFNIYFTKVLTPDLKASYKYFSIESIKTLLAAGIWSSITKLSQVLADGLDLLISNLFISALSMGQLSIAKTISTLMGSLLGTISSLFAPNLTLHYSKGDTTSLVNELKMGMKFTGFFANIPFCIFIVFGEMFFELWVPTQDTKTIYLLAILSIQGVVISGVTTMLNNIFLITNKLKVNSLFWLVKSMFDIIIVFTLLKTTNLGVFAIAGVSTLAGAICNLTFLPLYSSYCLHVKSKVFYDVILRYLATTIIMFMSIYLVKHFVSLKISWICLFLYGVVSALIGIAVNYIFLLNKNERIKLTEKFLKKVRK